MADKNPEIITLSSDDECKPQDVMQPSKKQKVYVNPTSSKKSVLQLRSGLSSNTRNMNVQKRVISENDSRVIELPLSKYQNTVQSKLNVLCPTKPSKNFPSQHLKNVKLLNSVSVKNCENTKSVSDAQNPNKFNLVSRTSSQTYLRSSTPKELVNQSNSRKGNNLNFIHEVGEVRTQNLNKKTSIPFSVLSALRKKGISITNVNEESKSEVDACNEQLESQNYLNNLKYSLKRSNTNINVVPETISIPTNKVVKSNSLSGTSIHGLKRKLADVDVVNLNKSQFSRRTIASSQNISDKSVKDLPIKIGPEIKIIKNPVTDYSSVNKTSRFIYNNSHSKNYTTTDSLITTSSKKSLSITPVECSKKSRIKEIFSLASQCRSSLPPQPSGAKITIADCSKRTASDLTVCFTSVPSASIRTVNSAIKSPLTTNSSKSSLSGVIVAKHQGTIKAKPLRTNFKNIEVTRDRDALLSFLALCDSTDDKQSNTKFKRGTSNAAFTIMPLPEPSVSLSESKFAIPLNGSIKIKDIPNKTCNWPKLVVSLERLDALEKFAKEQLISYEPITKKISLPETNIEHASEQESIECSKCPEKNSSNQSVKVYSKDIQLSSKVSDKKSECYNLVSLEHSVDNSISTKVEGRYIRNSVNSEALQQRNNSVNESLKEIKENKCLSSSSHLIISVDSLATFKEDSNNALNDTQHTNSCSVLNEASQNINIEMTVIDRPKNTDETLKVKSIQSQNKSSSCDKDISNSSKNLENGGICSETVLNPLVLTSVISDVCNVVKPNVFSCPNLICNAYAKCSSCVKISEREFEGKTDRSNFYVHSKNADYLMNSSNISELSVIKNLLSNIILNVENERCEEIRQQTCTDILNNIVSTIEKNSVSLLTEYETKVRTNLKQESIRNSPNKNSDLSLKNICREIIEKEPRLSIITYSAVDSKHCIETCEKNEKNLLKFDVLPSDYKKLSDCISVSDQVSKKASVNVCGVIDSNIVSDIITEFFVSPEEVPKVVLSNTFFSKTDNENKCRNTEVICETKVLNSCVTGRGNNDVTDKLKKLNSVSLNNCNEIEFVLSNKIVDNASSDFVSNVMQSSEHGLCFQNENVTSSPLHENGSLNCIIVNVEGKYNAFKEEDKNMDFENNSDFMQNLCVGEQENMDCNEKICDSYLKSFSEEDTSDKYVYACTDGDERASMLNQDHSNEVTSPKLSLKRNRSVESPDHSEQKNNANDSAENSFKRIKLEESILDVGHGEQISFDKSIVPCNSNREKNNKRKFMELLKYSKTLMDITSETEKEKIVRNLMKRLSKTESWFAGSKKFSYLIESVKIRFERMVVHNSDEDVFIILNDVMKEFRNYKCKVKVAAVKDTNSACSSFPLKGNCNLSSQVTVSSQPLNYLLIEETSKFSNFKDDDFEKSECNLQSGISSTSDSVASEGVKSASAKNIVVENENVSSKASTSFHSVLTPESADNLVFQDKTIAIANPSVNPVASSVIGASVFKSSIADNECNSFSLPSTSGLQLLTSETAEHAVLKNSIIEKNVSDCLTPSSSLHVLLPDSCESSVIKDITETRTHLQSISQSEQTPLATQNFDKISDTLPVLKEEKPAKEVDPRTKDCRSARRIKKLENLLQKLDKEIKKYQGKELSLDDLENEESAYIMEDKYKRRFNQVWQELCKLKKVPSRTGRIVEKKFKYEGSRYRLINVAVQKMIDKRKAWEKFPDYVEMLTLIKQVNDVQEIGLNERSVEIEAERVFRDVGKELQIRRCRDHEELFGCYLTDNFDPNSDPADHDEELKTVLATNNQNFEKSIAEVIDSYVEKQKLVTDDENNQDRNSSDEDDKEEKDEDDLPLTDPASPECSDTSDSRKQKINDDIIEIVYNSDQSTDPNEEINEKKVDKQEASTSGIHLKNFQNNEGTFIDSIGNEGSDSSGDLPSIQELMSTR